MKTYIGHIVIFLLCIPFGVSAQENGTDSQLEFYLQLAYKDAQYEQALQNLGPEDRADYWKDQQNFERALLEKNAHLHQAYINGKHIAYGQHQKRCSDNCEHSAAYFIQASYYAVKGVFEVGSNSVLSSEDTKRIKAIKIPKR